MWGEENQKGIFNNEWKKNSFNSNSKTACTKVSHGVTFNNVQWLTKKEFLGKNFEITFMKVFLYCRNTKKCLNAHTNEVNI